MIVVRVNAELCVGCKMCLPYCPVGAISIEGSVAVIDFDTCTECGACKRSQVCRFNAFEQDEMEWPRTVRPQLSDVFIEYQGVAGRGTEEMKTNDVTGRFKRGFSGVAIELGRPGVATNFRDVELLTKVVAEHGAIFEEKNPVTGYLADLKTGKFPEEMLDERVISAIIEILVENDKLEEMINAILEKSDQLDTVFSLDVACPVEEDNTVVAQEILDKMGISYRPNCKTNVGLGKPKYKEELK